MFQNCWTKWTWGEEGLGESGAKHKLIIRVGAQPQRCPWAEVMVMGVFTIGPLGYLQEVFVRC